jgi:hypothetical protein
VCIFNDIGGVITYEDQEPFAYLVGWVFGCIDTVRKFKEVKNATESKPANEEATDAQETCEKKEAHRNG